MRYKKCSNCGVALDPQENCDCQTKDIRPICYACSNHGKVEKLGFKKIAIIPTLVQCDCFICSKKTSILYELEKVRES